MACDLMAHHVVADVRPSNWPEVGAAPWAGIVKLVLWIGPGTTARGDDEPPQADEHPEWGSPRLPPGRIQSGTVRPVEGFALTGRLFEALYGRDPRGASLEGLRYRWPSEGGTGTLTT